MLLGNISVLHKSPALYLTGTTGFGDRSNSNKSGQLRAWGDNPDLNWSLTAIPLGYGPGGAWMLPTKAGNMVARNSATIALTPTGTSYAGFNVSASASLSLTTIATGELVANLQGSASVALGASGDAIATISGSGSAAISLGAAATINATKNLDASASISVNGTGTITATGSMSGEAHLAGEGSELTPANLAAAVWGESVEDEYTAYQIMRIMISVLSGRTTGIGTSTENFLSIDGSKPRVSTTFDGSNNRVGVVLDGDV